MGVRADGRRAGVVAVLVEDGGVRTLAVPLTPREGVSLSASVAGITATGWTRLLARAVEVLGGQLRAAHLDQDDDGGVTASLCLAGHRRVPCEPGEALLVAAALDLTVESSEGLLRLHGIVPGVVVGPEANVSRLRADLDSAGPEGFQDPVD